jgi:hypothetical protein
MNELEARRQLLADPRRLTPELRAAVADDPRLAAFRDRLLAADEEMHRVLTASPVPAGLADRIVLHARYGARSRWRLAMAASVAAVALAFSAYMVREPDPELARDTAILEHVAQNAGELAEDGRIEPAALRASVATLGVPVREGVTHVRHLANCVIDGIESRHFVVESARGIVSYVILPGASGRDASGGRMLSRDGFEALFVERAGVTIAVLAPKGASRKTLDAMMRDVVA